MTEAFAMLTARGVRFGVVGGGVADLTPSDIARMLKGLRREAYLAALVKECSDMRRLPDLERCVYDEGMRLARGLNFSGERVRRPWPTNHDSDLIRQFSALAITEFLLPHAEVCPKCNNRGWIKYEGNGIKCSVCDGFGGNKLSPHMRAQLAGIAFSRWRGGWDARYEQVFRSLNDWHAEAMAHLRLRLRAYKES